MLEDLGAGGATSSPPESGAGASLTADGGTLCDDSGTPGEEDADGTAVAGFPALLSGVEAVGGGAMMSSADATFGKMAAAPALNRKRG